MTYSEYISSRTKSIMRCISDLGCQPVIFAGAGLSKRYLGAPSWIELLDSICSLNPEIEHSLAYYRQRYGSLLDVGEELIPAFHTWAWGKGRAQFDDSLFDADASQNDFLKYFVAKYLIGSLPSGFEDLQAQELVDEIDLLKGIRPHSVVTTNYDTLCEMIFPDYKTIVGQKIIRSQGLSVGEIFKIHGCVSEPKEIVLTRSDYDSWSSRKKYLSAKLLTYLLEHPVLIIGYGAQDPNVLAILRDIDEILSSPGSLVSNIYYVIYDNQISDLSEPSSDMLLDLGDGASMRVNALYACDFRWIYQAFAANASLENVNPKLLRALMSRTYNLIRHDIPRMKVQVDFTTLEQAVSSDESLPKLLGITGLGDPDMFNAVYPYTLTAVAKKLGYKHWNPANQLYNQILREKGEDIKASDNQYHIKVKAGDKGEFRKYSEAFVELLRKVRDKEEYDVSLSQGVASPSQGEIERIAQDVK
jgi:hypothetical protein